MTSVIQVGPFPENPAYIEGGVQASVYGLAYALLKQNTIESVSVLSIPSKRTQSGIITKTIEGLEVTYLNAPYKYLASSIVNVPKAIKVILAHKNPVVHVHSTGLFQAALMAFLRIKRIPFVWTLHGITRKETWQRYRMNSTFGNFSHFVFYSIVEWFSLVMSRDIIVDTTYVATEVHAGKSTVDVVPQGIFMEEFAGLPDKPRREPLVISLGVLSPRKGHHLALQAYARVREKVPGVRIIIAGFANVPDYYQALKAQRTALGLENCVQFETNRTHEDIIALLGEARVFALHSEEESQGIALCEGLAAGLPIVATSVGGIPFVVDDQKTGFLVPFGDTEGFANAIIRLLTNDALQAQMSAQAKISARRFDWNTIAGNVAEIYKRASERY